MKDGIHGMLPREQMAPAVQKYWDYMNIKPNAPIYQKEFGYYSLEKWQREEGLSPDENLSRLFGFDDPAVATLHGLGGCEAAFEPVFQEEVLEDRGDYELVRDFAGRHVLYFKGRRNGFMPEYVDHPVKDQRTWEEQCLWRLDPNNSERIRKLDEALPRVIEQAKQGFMVQQYVVGGYMYLRSLIGPEQLLYMFYDDPELIEQCMEQWFVLADSVIARHQKQVSIDQILLEIPAGKLDSVDEDRFLAAKRELKEETGLEANSWLHLCDTFTTAGFSNEKISLYLARDLILGESRPDEDEFLNVVKMPFEEAFRMAMKGEIQDAKTLITLCMAKNII